MCTEKWDKAVLKTILSLLQKLNAEQVKLLCYYKSRVVVTLGSKRCQGNFWVLKMFLHLAAQGCSVRKNLVICIMIIVLF